MSMEKQGTPIARIEALLSQLPPHIIEQKPLTSEVSKMLNAIKEGHLPSVCYMKLYLRPMADILLSSYQPVL